MPRYIPLGLLKEIGDRLDRLAAAPVLAPEPTVTQNPAVERQRKKLARALAEARAYLKQTAPFQLDVLAAKRKEIERLSEELREMRENDKPDATLKTPPASDLNFFCCLRPALQFPFGLVVEAVHFEHGQPMVGNGTLVVAGRVVPGSMTWHSGQIDFRVELEGSEPVEVLPFDKNLDLLYRAGRCFELLAHHFNVSLHVSAPQHIIKQIDSIIVHWAKLNDAEKTTLINELLEELQFQENLREVPSFQSLRREIEALDYLGPLFRNACKKIYQRWDRSSVKSIAAEAIEKMIRNRFRQGVTQSRTFSETAKTTIWNEGFKGSILTAASSELDRIVAANLGYTSQVESREHLLTKFTSLLNMLGLEAHQKAAWQNTVDEILYRNATWWSLAEELLNLRAAVAIELLDRLPKLKKGTLTGSHQHGKRAAEVVRLINNAIEAGTGVGTLENDCQEVAELNRTRLATMPEAASAIDQTLIQTMLLYAAGKTMTPRARKTIYEALANAQAIALAIRHDLDLAEATTVFSSIETEHQRLTTSRLTATEFADTKEKFGLSKAYLVKNHNGGLDDYVRMLEVLDDHLIEMTTIPASASITFDEFFASHIGGDVTGNSELNRHIGERLHLHR